jgi:hypothetical protein
MLYGGGAGTEARRRLGGALGIAFLLAAACVFASAPAGAKRPGVKLSQSWQSFPSTKYAALGPGACLAELTKRKIAHTEVGNAPGVLAPVRVPRGISGIAVHTEAPVHARATTPYEVFDCRLVLAISDFAKILAAHDIDEVVMFSAWRPPGRDWPPGQLGTRHPGGLAFDVARFGKKRQPNETTKKWLDVLKDFHGAIGHTPCGADASAPVPPTPEAAELRSILCEAVDKHLFTVVLTPDYNAAHKNHFHLEVTPDVKWSLVR